MGLICKSTHLLQLTTGYFNVEGEVSQCYLRLLLKGHISEKHVVQEDAQGPHSGRYGMVAVVQDKLRRAVHCSACRGGGRGCGYN